MSDSTPSSASKTKIFLSALILLALVVAAFFTILSRQKESINNEHKHVVVPDPPVSEVTESVTVSEPTSSIRTMLIKHWPLSIAISVVLFVGIILAIVLPLVLEPKEVVVPEEDQEENVFMDDFDEPVIVQSNGSSLKKNIGIFLLVASVVGMVVVVVESARAAKAKKGHNGNQGAQDPQDTVKKNDQQVNTNADPNNNQNTQVDSNNNSNNNQGPQENPKPKPTPAPVTTTTTGLPIFDMRQGPSIPPGPNYYQQIPEQISNFFGGYNPPPPM